MLTLHQIRRRRGRAVRKRPESRQSRRSTARRPLPLLDRDAALQPHTPPGHGQELRAADAETFLLQRPGRRLSGLPRPRPEDGLRRGPRRARPGEITRTGRDAAVAARRQADDRLLQGHAARRGGALRAEPGDAVQESAGRFQTGLAARLGRDGDRVQLLARGQDEQGHASVRGRAAEPGAALCRERERVHPQPAQGLHEPAVLRCLPRAAAEAGDSGGDAGRRGRERAFTCCVSRDRSTPASDPHATARPATLRPLQRLNRRPSPASPSWTSARCRSKRPTSSSPRSS